MSPMETLESASWAIRLLVLGKTLTTENFRKMCIIVMDWCFMCIRHGWIVPHMLLYCVVAHKLWSWSFACFGIIWVIAYFVMELLACWMGPFGKCINGRICKTVPSLIMWCHWRERNAPLLWRIRIRIG